MYKSPDGYRYLCLMNVNDPRIHVIIRNLISQAVGEMGLKRAIVKNCQARLPKMIQQNSNHQKTQNKKAITIMKNNHLAGT